MSYSVYCGTIEVMLPSAVSSCLHADSASLFRKKMLNSVTILHISGIAGAQ